jgi:ABC-type bacteriocin/lantibiotic exporter with double-glycine peptidase domain
MFWVQIGLNIFISIADIASLAFLLLIINFYIGNSTAGLGFLPAWLLDRDSIVLIGFFLAFFALKNLAGVLINNSQFKFIKDVAVRISTKKLENYLQGDYTGFVQVDTAAHLRKIGFQPFEFCQHILSGIQQIIIQVFMVVLTIIAILLYNAQLFLLLFVVLLPPVIVVFFILKKRVGDSKKTIHASNEESFRYLMDAVKGYPESNIYQLNDFFTHRFAAAREKFSKHLFNSLAIQALPNRVIETFAVLGLFMLIAITKWSGINEGSMLITIGAFTAAAYKIIPGIVKIINASSQMRAYDFAINDLILPEKKLKNETKKQAAIESIELRDIDFQYADHAILNKFSFCVQKGDFIGIAGKSGKGKTTVLNLIIGFLSPSHGTILLNGEPASLRELKNIWPAVAYVRQQSFLINDSILQNIILGEDPLDEEKLKKVIELSGLSDLIRRYPEGVNKTILENGKNISGGQQQRIAIARALYKDAQLILLDEPFNELDEASTRTLVKYFKELSASGKIIIMITHDKLSLSFCNKIVSLDE